MVPGHRLVAGASASLCSSGMGLSWQSCMSDEAESAWGSGALAHGQGFKGARTGVCTWGAEEGRGRAKKSKLRETVPCSKQAPGDPRSVWPHICTPMVLPVAGWGWLSMYAWPSSWAEPLGPREEMIQEDFLDEEALHRQKEREGSIQRRGWGDGSPSWPPVGVGGERKGGKERPGPCGVGVPRRVGTHGHQEGQTGRPPQGHGPGGVLRAAQKTRTCTPLTPARGAASIPGAGRSGRVLGPFPGWRWGPGGHFRETVCWSLLGDTLLWRHCLRPSGDPVAASAQRYDPGGPWVGPYLSWASVSASAGWALGGFSAASSWF